MIDELSFFIYVYVFATVTWNVFFIYTFLIEAWKDGYGCFLAQLVPIAETYGFVYMELRWDCEGL